MNLDGFVEGTIVCPVCASFDCYKSEPVHLNETAYCSVCKSVFSIEQRSFTKSWIPVADDDIDACKKAIEDLQCAIFDGVEVAKKPEPPIILEDYKLEKFRNRNREQLRRQGLLKDE
jgi:hypothetical protein